LEDTKILLQSKLDGTPYNCMMSKTIFFLFFLIVTKSFAQEATSVPFNGKINANILDLGGIYIINLKTEKAVITDDNGSFSIAASVGDTLQFTSSQLKELKIVLNQKHFEKELFEIKMEMIVNQLREVVIKKHNGINAVALGIIPNGQKTYTPAERKLKTATSLNATANAGTMAGGSISADPLLNFLSGRTAMLKKELEVEKKQSYLALLEEMFDKNHFTNKFKIPLAYVKGFEYFAVENDKFTKILNAKNKTTVEFLLGELAIKYIDILACEK
jgi:hypothetical protein